MATWHPEVVVVGGGLAGSEAAWQLANCGLKVALVESKPGSTSPAHQTPLMCELVCSNSFRSDEAGTPPGTLKRELRAAGSLVLAAADLHKVPAGSALAIERFGFGREVTLRLAMHPNIRIERRTLEAFPGVPTIMCTGPLTHGPLAREMMRALGGDKMYFYDAIAPIVAADSIDWGHAFRASRWDKHTDMAAGEGAAASTDDTEAPPAGDYVNCPLSKDEYIALVEAISSGRTVTPKRFEQEKYFEGCLPIEVMAGRGLDVLRFGPMRPIGLTDPKTGRRPYAVVQLRPENRYQTAYNLVGYQTRLAYPEQARVFSIIPALRQAEFVRFGSIHRNTYIDAPRLLGPRFELRTRPNVRFAGLLTGVEGYIESTALGLLSAWLTAAELLDVSLPPPPPTTFLGALYGHVTRPRNADDKHDRFVPTNVNFSLMPPLADDRFKKDKAGRKAAMAQRAADDLQTWLAAVPRVFGGAAAALAR